MTARLPHDAGDLVLAPVALAVDARLAHLGSRTDDALAREIDALSERPTRDASERRAALLLAIGSIVDLHGWTLSWDEDRGVRLTHDANSVVLGVSESIRRYVAGPAGPPDRRAPITR